VLELDRARVATPVAPPSGTEPPHDGTQGNARVTAATAVALLVLLAAEGVTILSIRSLISLHVGIGMALVPVVLLKLGSTGWRFLRYYTRAVPYRAAGPPSPLMRISRRSSCSRRSRSSRAASRS
jgi:hypothetical protein